jgi:hypothetical protein
VQRTTQDGDAYGQVGARHMEQTAPVAYLSKTWLEPLDTAHTLTDTQRRGSAHLIGVGCCITVVCAVQYAVAVGVHVGDPACITLGGGNAGYGGHTNSPSEEARNMASAGAWSLLVEGWLPVARTVSPILSASLSACSTSHTFARPTNGATPITC